MTLTKDQILNVSKNHKKRIHVPLWAGDIYIKLIEAQHIFGLVDENQTEVDRLTNAIIASACTADGAPIFTKEDKESLAQQPFKVINDIFKEISDFNGLTSDGEDTPAEKNSESAS